MKKRLTALAGFLLIACMAVAQENDTEIQQTGERCSGETHQHGDDNDAYIDQDGHENTGHILAGRDDERRPQNKFMDDTYIT